MTEKNNNDPKFESFESETNEKELSVDKILEEIHADLIETVWIDQIEEEKELQLWKDQQVHYQQATTYLGLLL